MVKDKKNPPKTQRDNAVPSDKVTIPDIVIGRLPVYLRALSRIEQEGKEITSSHELGKRLGISSAQIRKDLSHFGEFGKQGTGYNVVQLSAALETIIGLDTHWHVALVGVGDLGRAIAHYNGFKSRGFYITHLFDADPNKIGTKLADIEILAFDDIVETIQEAGVQIAMIATPAEAAQAIADRLVEAGVRAILNYAPITISVSEGVYVQYIDPVLHLQRMVYYLD